MTPTDRLTERLEILLAEHDLTAALLRERHGIRLSDVARALESGSRKKRVPALHRNPPFVT